MDLVYVSYNSEKWLNKCLGSVMDSEIDLNNVHIYVVDNASEDNSVQCLKRIKEKYQKKVGSFEIIESSCNLGFGKANNLGFLRGNSEIVCFFNIDTELFPNTLKSLKEDIEKSDKDVALWELRQFPYEHPKLYDALTHETTWSSGAAFAIRREVYDKIGGFDEAIFMYAEDVDLSWRIRSFGYKLKYVPKAVIMHYSYQQKGEIKPTQHVNSVINNLLLRYRFGGVYTIFLGHKMFWKCMLAPEVFPGSKRQLFHKYLWHFSKIAHFWDRKKIGDSKEFYPSFIGFDYAGIREGAFYKNCFPENTPLVSIIVRTCGRPAVLKETLQSLKMQTYPNIEIVIVEDGQETAGTMIREEFFDLNIIYQATGEKVGRSKAGNLAMKIANGKYLNFLDDDDLFYADHVEILVRTLEKSTKRAAYAFAFETPIDVKSREPYVYEEGDYKGIHKQNFDKVMLCHHNYIPIQCIMFEKSLFEEYGGLDEKLDALEDWDLWVRYSLHTDFECVEKTTSIYRVPMKQNINEKRQKELDDALEVVRCKHKSYLQKISVYDIAKMYEKAGNL